MPDDRSVAGQHEELQPLLERADASGVVEAVELREALELLDLEPGDVEALHKELEERGIEVVDRQKEPAARASRAPRCWRRPPTRCSSSCARSGVTRS